MPRWLNVLGLVGCVVLAFTLPPLAVGIGVALFTVGLAGRWLVQRHRSDQRSAWRARQACCVARLPQTRIVHHLPVTARELS